MSAYECVWFSDDEQHIQTISFTSPISVLPPPLCLGVWHLAFTGMRATVTPTFTCHIATLNTCLSTQQQKVQKRMHIWGVMEMKIQKSAPFVLCLTLFSQHDMQISASLAHTLWKPPCPSFFLFYSFDKQKDDVQTKQNISQKSKFPHQCPSHLSQSCVQGKEENELSLSMTVQTTTSSVQPTTTSKTNTKDTIRVFVHWDSPTYLPGHSAKWGRQHGEQRVTHPDT